jgi:hypothetical protein
MKLAPQLQEILPASLGLKTWLGLAWRGEAAAARRAWSKCHVKNSPFASRQVCSLASQATRIQEYKWGEVSDQLWFRKLPGTNELIRTMPHFTIHQWMFQIMRPFGHLCIIHPRTTWNSSQERSYGEAQVAMNWHRS